jgi:tetratricopeptide (TPR) repeat protein
VRAPRGPSTGSADDAGDERLVHIRFTLADGREMQPQAAREMYRRQVEAEPGRAELRVRYGNVLRFLGHRDEAVRQYDAALSADPDNVEAALNLGMLAREAGDARRAHARHFLELAERAEPELRRGDQMRWIERLSAERDNLHAALRWAVDSGDAALALGLVAALGWYWFLRSARAEAIEWASQALALPGEAPPAVRAHALANRAMIAVSGGWNLASSRDDFDQAMRIVSGLPQDEQRRLHPLMAMLPVIFAIISNQDAVALRHVRELHDHPDPWMRALSHEVSAGVLVNLGEAAAAEAELDLALEGFRQLGERWGIGQALFARADLNATRGRHEVVVAALEEAREIFAGLGDREDVAALLIRAAYERARMGRMDEALRDLESADRIAHEVGAEDEKLLIQHTIAEIDRWRGRPDDARERLDAAIAEFRRSGHFIDQRQATMFVSRGHVEAEAGDLERARAWYERALALAVQSGDGPVIARVVELLARIALCGGDPERAAVLLGTGEVLRGMPDEADIDVVRTRADARAALGDQGFTLAYRRGAARSRDQVMAELRAEVELSSAAGTPAGPAERTPPQ